MGNQIVRHTETALVSFLDESAPTLFLRAHLITAIAEGICVFVLTSISVCIFSLWQSSRGSRKAILKDIFFQTFFSACTQLWLWILLLTRISWRACDLSVRVPLLLLAITVLYTHRVYLKRAASVVLLMPIWYQHILQLESYAIWSVIPAHFIMLPLFGGHVVFNENFCTIQYSKIAVFVYAPFYIVQSIAMLSLFLMPIYLYLRGSMKRSQVEDDNCLKVISSQMKYCEKKSKSSMVDMAKRNLLISSFTIGIQCLCASIMLSNMPDDTVEGQYKRFTINWITMTEQTTHAIVILLLFTGSHKTHSRRTKTPEGLQSFVRRKLAPGVLEGE